MGRQRGAGGRGGGAAAGRAARLKKVIGPRLDFWMCPRAPTTRGATVGTGLGPTDGQNAVWCWKAMTLGGVHPVVSRLVPTIAPVC